MGESVMDIEGDHIGRRVREIRAWRRLNLTATAGLAGMSAAYLSRIERGERAVTKRSTLEALANALKVAPAELTGKPYVPSDETSAEARTAMTAVADALTGWWVNEVPDAPGRPWPDIQADLDLLNGTLRPNSDYAAQALLLPVLIRDLLVAASLPDVRRAALLGLLNVYKAAENVSGSLGFRGLATVAAERMRVAAEELGEPDWCAFAVWVRAHALSGTNRVRQYQLAVQIADEPGVRPEVRGMANLTAALASAAQGQADVAQTHLAEAASVAETIEADVSPWGWGNLHFGRTNVGIWRVAIGVELGQGAQVAEIAATIRPETIDRSRQAALWIDYGRALLAERKTHDRGLAAILRAEKMAPQKTRNNVFVREAVADQLRLARRDAGSRELRGLAWRMGVAPTG